MKIDLMNEAFRELREDFAEAAEGVVVEMVKNKAHEAAVTVKVKIKLEGGEYMEDPTDETGEAVPAFLPMIGYEVKTSVKREAAKSEGRIGRPGDRLVLGRRGVELWTTERVTLLSEEQMEMIREDEA